MTSQDGYTGMMDRYGGTATSPGMPGGMMGRGMYGGTAMGTIMGRVLDNAPVARMSAADAAAQARAVPAGAVADTAHNRLTFATSAVSLTIVAGPDAQSMYRFEVAGMTDPQIVVPTGAHVTLRLINADTDMAHGIVVTSSGAAGAWMPMMTSAEAVPGAAIWALGDADSSGAPTETTVFTAATAGTYAYLCPVPGHAQQGMYGTLTVN
jgi:rusticyanin